MINIRLIAILVWALCLFAGAIQAAPRTCRIVFPDRPQNAPTSAYLFDGSRSHSITLPSMNFSEIIELPDGELSIAMVPKAVNNPGDLSPQAPLIKIPEDVSILYILLSSDAKNHVLPVRMELIDASQGKVNVGETLWCNVTEHRITAKLGAADLRVDPMGRTVSKPPAEVSGYYNASFSYEAEGNGASKPITEQSWWHDSNSRHLGFICYSQGKLPKIFYFRDFRIPKE